MHLLVSQIVDLVKDVLTCKQTHIFTASSFILRTTPEPCPEFEGYPPRYQSFVLFQVDQQLVPPIIQVIEAQDPTIYLSTDILPLRGMRS